MGMSNPTAVAFYRRWAAATFSPTFKRTGLVNLVVGVTLTFVAWKWPALGGLGTTLRWLLPVVAFLAFFCYLAVRAPLDFAREHELVMASLRRQAEAMDRQLRETRDCQSIADFLTKEHHYGIHQILHKPPKDAEELKEWNRWVENWNTGIFARMEAFGCTLQDLNHVKTIAMVEVLAGLPDEPSLRVFGMSGRESIMEQFAVNEARAARALQIPIRMHAIRLSRVADISTKYAERAEAITLAATKQRLARDD